MKGLTLVAFYWLHLISTVVWIGGIIFILFIAIPSAKQVLAGEAGKLMGEISRRFTPLVNYSIIFLVVTGIVLTALNKKFTGIITFGNNWTLVLTLKHILVLGMIVVHFYRGLLLAPKIGRTTSFSKKTSLQKLSLNLVKVNLALGVTVLVLAGITSVL